MPFVSPVVTQMQITENQETEIVPALRTQFEISHICYLSNISKECELVENSVVR